MWFYVTPFQDRLFRWAIEQQAQAYDKGRGGQAGHKFLARVHISKIRTLEFVGGHPRRLSYNGLDMGPFSMKRTVEWSVECHVDPRSYRHQELDKLFAKYHELRIEVEYSSDGCLSGWTVHVTPQDCPKIDLSTYDDV